MRSPWFCKPDRLDGSSNAGRRGDHGLLAGCGGAGVVGGAAYSSFLVAPLVGSRLSAADSFVSELEVAGQPASGLFRLADVASALLLVVLAVGLLRWWRPDLPGILGCLCMAGVGLASAADAAEAMPCAPSISASCRYRLDRVPITAQLHQWHTLSSVAGFLFAVLGMLIGGSGRAGAWPHWSSASRVMGLAVAVLGGLEVPLTFTGRGVGAIERMQVVVVSLWITGLGWQLYRFARRPTRWADQVPRDSHEAARVAGSNGNLVEIIPGPPSPVRSRSRLPRGQRQA